MMMIFRFAFNTSTQESLWESGKMMFIVDIVILISMIEDLRVSATVMEMNCVLTGTSVRPTKQDCLLPGRREYEERRGL